MNRSTEAGTPGSRDLLLLLAIAYLGFISLGFPDPVAGVAWPSMRTAFGLEQDRFGLIFLGLGCGYCASGFFGGKLTLLLGLGNLLWGSSLLVAAAMFASGGAPGWWLVVAAAVIWGLGSGGIDAGLNAYAARHFSARHMNWLHACYSVGATLGPLAMTASIVRWGNWRLGYAGVGVVLAAMAGLFLATRRRWDDPEPAAAAPRPAVGVRRALAEPLVRLQIVMFFLYVGLEFTVGQWSFTLLTEARGVSPERAGLMVAVYYGAIGAGRVVAGVVAHRLGIDRLVRLAMSAVIAGTACYAFAPVGGETLGLDFAGLSIVGLGLAPIFPCLMARTPQRLGDDVAAHAVGFQVSAGMLGAALVPGLAGLLVERTNLEIVPRFALVTAVLLMGTHEWVVYRTERSASTATRV